MQRPNQFVAGQAVINAQNYRVQNAASLANQNPAAVIPMALQSTVTRPLLVQTMRQPRPNEALSQVHQVVRHVNGQIVVQQGRPALPHVLQPFQRPNAFQPGMTASVALNQAAIAPSARQVLPNMMCSVAGVSTARPVFGTVAPVAAYPVSLQNNRPLTPVITQNNRLQTPVIIQNNRLQTPIITQNNRPQTPVTSQNNRPQTPVVPQNNRPQTPVTSQNNRPQTPVALTPRLPSVSPATVLTPATPTPNPAAPLVNPTLASLGSTPGSIEKPAVRLKLDSCVDFFNHLIAKSFKQSQEAGEAIRSTIQSLIDGRMSEEEFTGRLNHDAASRPKTEYILKMAVPLIRTAMVESDLKIDGIRPPNLPPASLSNPPQTVRSFTTAAAAKTPTSTALAGAAASAIVVRTQQQQQQSLQQANAVGPAVRPQSLGGNDPAAVRAEHGQSPATAVVPNMARLQQGSLASIRPTLVAGGGSSIPHASIQIVKRDNSQSSSTNLLQSVRRVEKRRHCEVDGQDEDINDVTTLAGVDVREEAAMAIAPYQAPVPRAATRPLEDAYLNRRSLKRRIEAAVKANGVDAFDSRVIDQLCLAARHFQADVLADLAKITTHRLVIYKNNENYSMISNAREQIKFVQEVQQHQQQQQQSSNGDVATKRSTDFGRSSINIDESNNAAWRAIGSKRHKIGSCGTFGGSAAGGGGGGGGGGYGSLQVRSKRANVRDLLHVMRNDQLLRSMRSFYKASWNGK